MKKEIKRLSRAQTAKIRQNLAKTFYNIKADKKNINIKNTLQTKPKRPLTSYHDTKLSQLYLPPTELLNEKEQNVLKVNEEYQKHHLNEINIHNLFTEKLWEKNNIEKNEDYTKKIAYKKLLMRAKLLKAMKTNIVLRQKDFEEFNSKYYEGNKLLSEKIKKKKRKDSDDISLNDSDNNIKEKPNFNTIKIPDIFSQYEYTSLFQDYFCSPIELIEKIFNYDEQRIIKLDPIFFRLNRYPFTGVQKNFGFSLKDKINEEDNIIQQKIEKIKEINQKFFNVKRRQKRRKTEVEKNDNNKETIEEKNINININNNKKFKNNRIKSAKPLQVFFPNNDIKNNADKNKFKNYFNNLFRKTSKKNKKIKLDLTEAEKSRKKLKFNLNTDYNVYLEIKKQQNKKNKKYQTTNYLYNDEEKIKDKKKRLTMEELLDIYHERKKLYLDDMSYNRKKNKYKFEKLRIKKHEENEKENYKKENLRKILMNIEENYKLIQK